MTSNKPIRQLPMLHTFCRSERIQHYLPSYRSTWPGLPHVYQIEILPAGEEGPRHLQEPRTVMRIGDIPFLTVSEFIRAKMKAWVMCVVLPHLNCLCHSFLDIFSLRRRAERDAQDIIYVFTRY